MVSPKVAKTPTQQFRTFSLFLSWILFPILSDPCFPPHFYSIRSSILARVSLTAIMIRRPATQINLKQDDVDDLIKHIVARQAAANQHLTAAEAQARANANASTGVQGQQTPGGKGGQGSKGHRPEQDQVNEIAAEARRKREERIGL